MYGGGCWEVSTSLCVRTMKVCMYSTEYACLYEVRKKGEREERERVCDMQIYEESDCRLRGYEREDGRGVHIRVRPSITWEQLLYLQYHYHRREEYSTTHSPLPSTS